LSGIISVCGEKNTIYPRNHYILYNLYPLLMAMKMPTARKEKLLPRPLLVVAAAVAAAGSILFTGTPAAFADDLTEEDILSLQDPSVVKVTICHIPPGNPAERHEITVGEPAVAAHIRDHGDYIGPCSPNPDPDGP
jgi:hypothetical protein